MAVPKFLTMFVVFLFLCILDINGQDSLSIGFTVSLNHILYYVPGRPLTSGYPSIYSAFASDSTGLPFGLVPVTVINLDSASLNIQTVETIVETFGKQDDVWGKAFLPGKTSIDTFNDTSKFSIIRDPLLSLTTRNEVLILKIHSCAYSG